MLIKNLHKVYFGDDIKLWRMNKIYIFLNMKYTTYLKTITTH